MLGQDEQITLSTYLAPISWLSTRTGGGYGYMPVPKAVHPTTSFL